MSLDDADDQSLEKRVNGITNTHEENPCKHKQYLRIGVLGVCAAAIFGYLFLDRMIREFDQIKHESRLEKEEIILLNQKNQLIQLRGELEQLKTERRFMLYKTDLNNNGLPEIYYEIDGKKYFFEIDGKSVDPILK